MITPLLVVTPDDNFGELLRQSLEETGSYTVYVLNDRLAATALMREEKCPLAILDMDLGEDAVSELGRALRKNHPDVKLIIVSAEDHPSAALDELRPWELLHKPFYLPDLLAMLEQPSENKRRNSSPENRTTDLPDTQAMPWLRDMNKAAQHLTRLTLESSAQATLLTRHNKLWAYAGQLSRQAADELTHILARHWDAANGSDLLRFVRLETTQAEHMLYATRLSRTIVLAMVFDAETPFSTIRNQANQLARSLSISEAPSRFTPEAPADDDEEEIPSIAEILDNIPRPDPENVTPPSDRMTANEPDEKERGFRPSFSPPEEPFPTVSGRPPRFSQEASPAIPLKPFARKEQAVGLDERPHIEKGLEEDLDITRPSTPTTSATPEGEGELDETRPHSITEVAGRAVLEPVSPALYNLTYACLLVPRFNHHHLTGDLAERLSIWLSQICIAFGWRLEYIAVRPDYLQWIVNVPPSTSPGYLMRIVRQQTSERIFSEFPRLKRENPSGDFWAPGYLIMGGKQPHPPKLVKDYIKQTRKRQGLSKK